MSNQERQAILVKQIIVHQMMKPEELAAWFNISLHAIYMMVSRSRRGKGNNPIPFYQPGGKGGELRFDYNEIVKWARGGVQPNQ
jgi:hypothetical protein